MDATKKKLMLLLGGGSLLTGLALYLSRNAIAAVATAGGNMLTLATDNASFISNLWDAIDSMLPQLSIPARTIIVAHAAYESGWGQKGAVAQGASNDIFNITAGSVSSTENWDGQRVTVAKADYTYLPKGTPKPLTGDWELDATLNQWRTRITQTWRIYPDYETAVADYYDFLGPKQNGGRYVTARAALDRGDVASFARELGLHGYYDVNISDSYIATMTKMIGSVQKYL